ncbi:hypothetical protein Acsp05_64580 [Actinokineospora sp. NBRC 105648]|nr:hypothetical protein Acsp05_64580 [Actinokineospora sp. NBRC 105648]
MSSEDVAGPVVLSDRLGGALERLRRLVAAVSTTHLPFKGVCGRCATAWPCSWIVLAEHNRGLLRCSPTGGAGGDAPVVGPADHAPDGLCR